MASDHNIQAQMANLHVSQTIVVKSTKTCTNEDCGRGQAEHIEICEHWPNAARRSRRAGFGGWSRLVVRHGG